jgi:CHAT domain-containing protein
VARYGRPADLLLGSRATETATVRALARPAAVLHLAVHGIVDDQSQFNTAIALASGEGSDGFLTPAELGRLSLSGTLVVLSACRSAAGQVLAGEGLRGLTAPLLEAGARAVVGTYWSIGDRSVVPFVDRFYAAMAEGLRADDALRRTRLEAIRDGASIADWASFSITGDGSARPSIRAATRASPMNWLRAVTQGQRGDAPIR